MIPVMLYTPDPVMGDNWSTPPAPKARPGVPEKLIVAAVDELLGTAFDSAARRIKLDARVDAAVRQVVKGQPRRVVAGG